MNKSKLFAATMLLACIPATFAIADDLKDYRGSIEGVGLAPILPANSAFAPGYVYKLLKNDKGQVFPARICDNLFLTPSTSSAAGLPALDGNKKFNLNFGFKFLPGFIADKLSAVFGLDVSKNTATNLSFENMEIREIPQRNDLAPDKKTVVQRAVNPACAANLAQEPLDGDKFKNRVFLVMRSVTASGFNYDLAVTNGTSAGKEAIKDTTAPAAKTDGKTTADAGDKSKTTAETVKTTDKKAEAAPTANEGDATAAKPAVSASPKTAPNTATAEVKLADQIELSGGWTFEKTGTQTFKVKQDKAQTPVFFAADVVRLRSAADATAVSATPTLGLYTVKPTANDLDALVTPSSDK